jgi:hypothetical protein
VLDPNNNDPVDDASLLAGSEEKAPSGAKGFSPLELAVAVAAAAA